jgi:hypothetical protein
VRFAGPPQQRKVLHVAGTQLNHVGITLDQIDAGLIKCLSDNLQTISIANIGQDFQAFFAQTLKCIR